MAEGRTCDYCSEFKPFNLFRKAKNCKDGYRRKCKECEKPIRQKYYRENKEKCKEHYNLFLDRNPNYRHEYYIKNKISN